jgi:hypothetical protein
VIHPRALHLLCYQRLHVHLDVRAQLHGRARRVQHAAHARKVFYLARAISLDLP